MSYRSRPRSGALAVAFTLVLAVLLLAARAGADDGAAFQRALDAADRSDWSVALAEGRKAGEIEADVIEWRYLRESEPGTAPFSVFVEFLRRRPGWPNEKLLRKNGEASIDGAISPVLVRDYFSGGAPQTGAGSFMLALALRNSGDEAAARAEAVRGWRSLPMSPEDQALFLANFGDDLAENHDGRITAMLWQGERASARQMLPLVGGTVRLSAEARLALQSDADDASARVAAATAVGSPSSGLSYDRFRWRIRHDLYDSAIDLLLERSTSAAALGYPSIWAEWRRKLARKEMREGDAQRAYRVASTHHLTPEDGADYNDLEWLSGYIALRKLGNPALAMEHFDRFARQVRGPISLSRAAYWRGRAFEAMGQADAARAAYAEGARYQTAFYGLLSAEKVGLPLSPAMKGGESYPDWRGQPMTESALFRAGRALMAVDSQALAGRFFLQQAKDMSGEEIGRLAGMALEANEAYLALTLAKAAAERGVIWPSAYFPLVGLDHISLPVRTELVLSIARRESEFNPVARSGAGALGLMQVMPQTGRELAKKLGVPYSSEKLATDFDYSATLGATYLAGLERQFGTSPLLVGTGYNAGPGRARQWIGAFGDPRADGVDPIDWIEAMPFDETQTYVMRVAESLPIYRARLSGETGPLAFTDLLKGR